MKAVFYLGKEHLKVDETPVPELRPEEALIQVRNAGICGTDLSIMAGSHPRARAPLIMGHEFSGLISRYRGARTDLKEGDHVVVEPLISCGKCFSCVSGYSHVCQRLGLFGIDAPGAFAEFVAIPDNRIFKIPPDLPFDIAALIEPIAVAVHSVRMSALQIGDTVCVLGAGPIGILNGLVASMSGAKEVYIFEKEPLRLKTAALFGLESVDVAAVDVEAFSQSVTGGRGFDIVFEAAGAPQTILLAPRICRVRGEVIQVAMPKFLREIDVVAYTFKEITMKGVRVYAAYDFERAIEIASTTPVDLRLLIAPPYPLEQAETAFQKAASGSDVMRVLFGMEGRSAA